MYLRPADGLALEEIDGELCLMRLDTKDVLVLNRTASDVWLLISDHLQEVEIVAALSRSYAVPADVMGRDVAPVLDQLRRRGFVHELSDP